MGGYLKITLFLTVFLFVCIEFCKSDSLIVGSSVNGRLAFVDSVKLSAIPLKTRTKNVFYNGDTAIKGISVIDMSSTKAKASITSGGVGSTFTNIKLKSERGEELNYQIQIFV